VHSASDRLNRYQGQLGTLLSALQLVQNEPELQTPPIEKQVEKIITLGKELQRQIDAFAAQLSRSKTKQYTHAFISGDKDEREARECLHLTKPGESGPQRADRHNARRTEWIYARRLHGCSSGSPAG
jgi:hypothetical protein